MFLDIYDEIGNSIALFLQFEEDFTCVNAFSNNIFTCLQSAVDCSYERIFNSNIFFEFILFLEAFKHNFITDVGTHIFFDAFGEVFFLRIKIFNSRRADQLDDMIAVVCLYRFRELIFMKLFNSCDKLRIWLDN